MLHLNKADIYAYCKRFIDERLDRIQVQIKEINSALTSESKSSAGDKHETGRAMLQLEREKLGQQLYEAEKMAEGFRKVNPNSLSKTAILGSLVMTNSATYYLAISAGKYSDHHYNIYCISTITPIGQLLMGKKKGDSIVINGQTQAIISVL